MFQLIWRVASKEEEISTGQLFKLFNSVKTFSAATSYPSESVGFFSPTSEPGGNLEQNIYPVLLTQLNGSRTNRVESDMGQIREFGRSIQF
jgi:hypothetical protein